jgi:hypothetical protein
MSDSFDDHYWNLAQAAAWVEYRSRELVKEFEHATCDDYIALDFYPTMHRHQKVGEIVELHRCLISGTITAWGRARKRGDQVEQISPIEWRDLSLRPPCAYRSDWVITRLEPWTDIRVRSADIKRLWRSEFEKAGRSKFDWDLVRSLWEEAAEGNPAFSQNGLIEEVQYAYRDRLNKEPPGRSSIQRHLKKWT